MRDPKVQQRLPDIGADIDEDPLLGIEQAFDDFSFPGFFPVDIRKFGTDAERNVDLRTIVIQRNSVE
ncbi:MULTISPECIES: hypothetical protein [Methylomicrobium]|uniref:hypothetical protein n=1 Tax=Methylomicrobium TaxID=39773 RepID=UPI0004DF7520|nr:MULTISPECIES: hypothetical protein [Methylomicrobium]